MSLPSPKSLEQKHPKCSQFSRPSIITTYIIFALGFLLVIKTFVYVVKESRKKKASFWTISLVGISFLLASRILSAVDDIVICTLGLAPTYGHHVFLIVRMIIHQSCYWIAVTVLTSLRFYRLALVRVNSLTGMSLSLKITLAVILLIGLSSLSAYLAQLVVQLQYVDLLWHQPDKVRFFSSPRFFTTWIVVSVTYLLTFVHILNMGADIKFWYTVTNIWRAANTRRSISSIQIWSIALPYLMSIVLVISYLGFFIPTVINLGVTKVPEYVTMVGVFITCWDYFVFYHFSLKQTRQLLNASGGKLFDTKNGKGRTSSDTTNFRSGSTSIASYFSKFKFWDKKTDGETHTSVTSKTSSQGESSYDFRNYSNSSSSSSSSSRSLSSSRAGSSQKLTAPASSSYGSSKSGSSYSSQLPSSQSSSRYNRTYTPSPQWVPLSDVARSVEKSSLSRSPQRFR
ncbi:hypothetical protein BKA69DRAFT_1122404 [Paraphysoderma sedebokerense]|nr:hypothetical protein BKA69DRAFT_1122404 [Paraphysoderma sedebokerense]